MTDDQACANTDRELYREPDKGNGSFYSDSIHVTEGGGIGMNVGGYVIVMPIHEWHAAARDGMDLQSYKATTPTSPDGESAEWIALTALRSELERVKAERDTAVKAACEPWKFCNGDPPDWESPLMNVWQAACCWTMDIVGKSLGATDWERGDGSESIDGDLNAEVTNIMRAAGLVNDDDDPITREDIAAFVALRAHSQRMREALEPIIDCLNAHENAKVGSYYVSVPLTKLIRLRDAALTPETER